MCTSHVPQGAAPLIPIWQTNIKASPDICICINDSEVKVPRRSIQIHRVEVLVSRERMLKIRNHFSVSDHLIVPGKSDACAFYCASLWTIALVIVICSALSYDETT